MSEVAASSVQGADPTGEGPSPNTILDPVILRFAVLTYLVVLPVGHLVAIPVNRWRRWCMAPDLAFRRREAPDLGVMAREVSEAQPIQVREVSISSAELV